MTLEDLAAWEVQPGEIRPGSVVLMLSGDDLSRLETRADRLRSRWHRFFLLAR